MYRDSLYCYPIELRIGLPPSDVKYGKLASFQLNGIDSMAKVDKWQRYLKCAALLTDGFTKSQHGFTITNVREEYNKKHPGNPIYNKPKYKKMDPIHDEVMSNKIFWPSPYNYSYMTHSGTWEKKKKRNDLKNTDAELFWKELNKPFTDAEKKQQLNDSDAFNLDQSKSGNEDDSENDEDEDDQDDVDEQTKKLQEELMKFEIQAKKNSDKNLLKIAIGDNEWMIEYLELALNEPIPPTYTMLEMLVQKNRFDIKMTQFDCDYIQHVGDSKFCQNVYPKIHQDKMENVKLFEWKFCYKYKRISDITPESTSQDVSQCVRAVHDHVMILGLYYNAQYMTSNNIQWKVKYEELFYPLVKEFVNLYHALLLLHDIKPQTVLKILKTNEWLAYIMQHCKWMLYLNQKYCAIFQNDESHELFRSKWRKMSMDDKYALLSVIWSARNEKHVIVDYLRETGLPTLFTLVFRGEQDKWKRLLGKALRYNELWSLKPDWEQKQQERDQRLLTANKKRTDSDAGLGSVHDQETGAPMRKIRKIMGKTKKEQQTQVISTIVNVVLHNWEFFVDSSNTTGDAMEENTSSDAVGFDFDKFILKMNTEGWEKQIPQYVIDQQGQFLDQIAKGGQNETDKKQD